MNPNAKKQVKNKAKPKIFVFSDSLNGVKVEKKNQMSAFVLHARETKTKICWNWICTAERTFGTCGMISTMTTTTKTRTENNQTKEFVFFSVLSITNQWIFKSVAATSSRWFFFLRFICLESTKTTGENSVFKILTNFPNAHRTVRAQNRTRTQQIYISVQKRTNRISESFFLLFLFVLYSDKFAQQQKTVRESQNRKIHAFTW